MEEKRVQIKKYFQPFPKVAIWAIIAGVVLIDAYGLGLILIGIGVGEFRSYSKKPTDQQIDTWINEDLKPIKQRALTKTGLDQSELVRESVLVTSPRFWNIGGAEVGLKKGKDQIIRFMPLGVTVINFGADQLAVYQCVIDLTTGNQLSESSKEYFYSDVVSVETKTSSLTLHKSEITAKTLTMFPILRHLMQNDKLQFNEAEKFILTTSGGTSIEVVLRAPALIQSAGGGTIPTELAEQAILAIRTMLRETKKK